MKCDTNLLFDYIDGILNDENTKKFELHLEKCENCRNTISTFNLMESVKEHYYDVPIDIVKSVKNSTDKELYSNKKYLFINKFLSKKMMKKYVSAAIFVLILTGSFIIGENYTLISDIKDYAMTTFSKRNFQRELDDYTKSIVNTSSYNGFKKLIDDKQYKMVDGTIVGAPIHLPNSLKTGKNGDNTIIDLLNHGNTSSIYNGLDFSGYLGKNVMLLTCIIEEPNKITREFICLLNGDRPIGYWESPSINDQNSQLDSRLLLKSLIIDKADSSIKDEILLSQNLISLEKLPKTYTQEMSRSNGDVIYNAENNNIVYYHKFLNDVENKINSKVRLTKYLTQNDATIIDLKYENGNIKAIVDTTRSSSAERKTEEFSVIRLNKEEKNNIIYYTATLDTGNVLVLANSKK